MIAKQYASGFTLVEVAVAIFISTLLIIGIYSASTGALRISEGASQRMTASNLAYSNLRKYTDGRTNVLWPDSPAPQCTSSSSNAELYSSTSAVTAIPNPVTQVVTIYAPYGCPTPTNNVPYRVESYVQYGSNNIRITHAMYTN